MTSDDCSLRGARLLRGWTQEEAVDEFLRCAAALGVRSSLSVRHWRRWESPEPPWPHRSQRQVLEALFGLPMTALGFEPPQPRAPSAPSGGLTPRRAVLSGALAAAAWTFDTDAPAERSTMSPRSLDEIAAVLLGHELPSPVGTAAGDLAAVVKDMKQRYQACRYDALAAALPSAMDAARAATAEARGRALDVARAHYADILHTTASLLLKLGRRDLALVAADRAVAEAAASGDPIARGCADRVVVHASLAAGSTKVAARLTERASDRLTGSRPPAGSRERAIWESVHGALLLRGAVAAARDENREFTHELLNAAERSASVIRSLPEGDGNLAWTAFGPANVTLHRLSTSVELGDAGAALAIARTVDPSELAVTERRVTFSLDVARAHSMWGKPDRAVEALVDAERVAAHELRVRAGVHELVAQLQVATSGPARVAVDGLARRLGLAA